MKIAITGAQSTGKSTLLRYLKNDDDLQGFEFIGELTRKIAAKGININEEGSNLSQIFTVTIHAENIIKDHFISDRCALDGLVYTKWLYDQGKVDQWILDYALGVAKEVLHRYDFIFYLPPEIPIEDDGIRSANSKFRDEIVELFEYYIHELNITVHLLTGSVKGRAMQFKKLVAPNLFSPIDLHSINSISDLSSYDDETSHYLTDAYNYWVENGFNKSPNSKILFTSDISNAGWAFIRENGTSCHLSRFTVERKGGGLGGKIFRELKRRYSKVTLWSNSEAVEFYKRNGVEFTDKTTEVEGKSYIYGECITSK